ncbi:hypothetical protein BGX30_004651, partial [Mortierella sp. GBA39]
MDLQNVKEYLRVDYDEDDFLITGFITAAKEYLRNAGVSDGQEGELYSIVVLMLVSLFYENREVTDKDIKIPTEFMQIWAEIIPQTAALQRAAADTKLSNTTHKIKVRYGSGKLIKQDMWITFKGHRFDIKNLCGRSDHMTARDDFDFSGINAFTGQLLQMAEVQFPKDARRFMQQEGNKLRRVTAAKARQLVKRKTGNYLKGIKRGKVYKYQGEELA